MARSGGDGLTYWALRQGVSQDSQLKADSLRAKLIMQRRRMQAERSEAQIPQVEGPCVVDMTWADSLPPCPVYYPSKKEFEDPLEYIQQIAPEASKYGMCKVVSPLVSSVSAGHVLTREKSGFKFTPRVQPMRLSNWDSTDMHKFLISGQQYSFHEYEKMANKFYSRRFGSTACLPPKAMEVEFWKELGNGKINVEYGCDIEGSAFSSSPNDSLGRSKWNLNNFSHLADSTLRLLESAIPGVTEPMLYIGMAFAMFAWHVEDHYLFSINYHHSGAPKTWYGVPGRAAAQFERVVLDRVYDKDLLAAGQDGLAYNLLIGKTTMFSPKLLVDHNVQTYRAVQSPGEFVVTFPRAYHAGFSHGFNCSEAVNFTMGDWFPFGTAACVRYELLKRIPLLPHEELLCKEAESVASSMGVLASKGRREAQVISSNSLKRRHSIKVAFVRFMKFQHQVRWLLQRSGAQIIFRSPGFDGSVMCVLCKHMCYLSFITCSCSATPMCLNHATEMRECHCGVGRSVVVRETLLDMEQTALKFEDEDGVRREARGPPTVDVATTIGGIITEEDMLDDEDYKEYTPLGHHPMPARLSSILVHGPNRSSLETKGSYVSKAAFCPGPLSASSQGGQFPSSIAPISKPRETADELSRKQGCSGNSHDWQSSRWSQELSGKVCEQNGDATVHLPASAKRKRSFNCARKGPATGGKVHSKGRAVQVKHLQSVRAICEDDEDDEDEDEDEDEDYWP